MKKLKKKNKYSTLHIDVEIICLGLIILAMTFGIAYLSELLDKRHNRMRHAEQELRVIRFEQSKEEQNKFAQIIEDIYGKR